RSTRRSETARIASSRSTHSPKPQPRTPFSKREASERHNPAMRVSAKVDYALRACAELAVAGEGPVKGERLSQAQEIPVKFLENILLDLKHAGLVQSQRGAEAGTGFLSHRTRSRSPKSSARSKARSRTSAAN